MSNIPGVRLYPQIQSLLTRAPTSENLFQTLGSAIAFLLDKQDGRQIDFRMNGKYANFGGTLAFDGFLPFKYDAEITDVAFYSKTPGSGGTTEVDVKYSATPGGSFTSIFSTTPKAISTHAANSWIFTGGVVTGMTAPVLSTSPFQIAAGGALKFDVLQAMTGEPENIGIILFTREI